MNNFILFFLLKKRKKMKRLKLLKIKIWMQDPSSKFPILHRVIGLMLIGHARSNVEFHEAPSVLFRRKKKEKVVEIFKYCLPYFSTWTSLTMTWLTLLSESGARVLSALRTRPSSMHNYEIIIIKSVLLLVAVHTIVVTHLSRHTEYRRPCHPTPSLEDPRRLW